MHGMVMAQRRRKGSSQQPAYANGRLPNWQQPKAPPAQRSRSASRTAANGQSGAAGHFHTLVSNATVSLLSFARIRAKGNGDHATDNPVLRVSGGSSRRGCSGTERRVGARSPGPCPSLSVTLAIGITSRPIFDPARRDTPGGCGTCTGRGWSGPRDAVRRAEPHMRMAGAEPGVAVASAPLGDDCSRERRAWTADFSLYPLLDRNCHPPAGGVGRGLWVRADSEIVS